jgi:hypothetical protein
VISEVSDKQSPSCVSCIACMSGDEVVATYPSDTALRMSRRGAHLMEMVRNSPCTLALT